MAKHLRYYTLLFQSLFILPIAQANEWDWVPRESLNASEQATLNQYCRGAYIDGWQVADDDNTHLLADMIYRDEQGTLYMEGAASLRQPFSQLDANHITGVQGKFYQAQGDVALRADGQLIRSEQAYISTDEDNQTAKFSNAKFLSHNIRIRGEASEISRTQDGLIFIKEGFYTTCEPGEGSWTLYGSSVELSPEFGFGTAKHVQIKVRDIPVFYLPWLRFPLDERRQSGFLFPSMSYSNDNLTVSAPYYLNLAANYDATVTPNAIIPVTALFGDESDDTGQGFDFEFRYLGEYGRTQFEQSTFYDSHGDQGTLRKLVSDQQFTDQFGAGVFLEDSPTGVEVPEVNNTGVQEQDNYERRVYGRYQQDNFLSDVQVRRFQTPSPTADQPLEWLPRVNASYEYANKAIHYSPIVEFTNFYEPDKVGADGQRAAFNQDINLERSTSWSKITVGALHQYRDYRIHDYDYDEDRSTNISHLSYYFDSSLIFERPLDSQWRQTLSPQFSYLNAPYKNQSDIPDFDGYEMEMTYAQAFSHRRFTGNDRIGDTEQVALGVDSRFYNAQNIQRWTLQAGQVFYLEDRKIGIEGDTGTVVDDNSHSPVLTSATYHGDHFSLANNFNYDFDQNQVDLAQSAFSYKPDNGLVFNLSFSYVYDENEDDMTKQSSFGTILPLTDNWHLFHQQSYDWLDREQTAQVEGLGFENCCVKASVSYQRWRDDDGLFDEGLFLQFILRSLSGVGRTNSDLSTIADDYWNQGKVGY